MTFSFLHDYVIKDANKTMITGGDNCTLKGGINFEYVIISSTSSPFTPSTLLRSNVDSTYYRSLHCKYISINAP